MGIIWGLYRDIMGFGLLWLVDPHMGVQRGSLMNFRQIDHARTSQVQVA